MIKIYIKKPEPVEALQWLGDKETTEELRQFCPNIDKQNGRLFLKEEGKNQEIQKGDYIIKDEKGHFTLVCQNHFEEDYLPYDWH